MRNVHLQPQGYFLSQYNTEELNRYRTKYVSERTDNTQQFPRFCPPFRVSPVSKTPGSDDIVPFLSTRLYLDPHILYFPALGKFIFKSLSLV